MAPFGIRTPFVSLSDDFAAECVSKGGGFGVDREVEVKQHPCRGKAVPERRRLEPLVIEPGPHRLDGLAQPGLLGKCYFDRVHLFPVRFMRATTIAAVGKSSGTSGEMP